jgi:hypothetical protein
MTERKYLPTFAELCDRLSIVMLKQIFIQENREAYIEERKLIEHDIDLLVQGRSINSEDIRALMILMLVNREIWLNESEARQGGSEQDHLLKFTHSINGIRTRVKNILSCGAKERIDLKVDSFAANLPPEFGNWDIL